MDLLLFLAIVEAAVIVVTVTVLYIFHRMRRKYDAGLRYFGPKDRS